MSKAINRLNVPNELVGFSEINKHAIKSFSSIHNINSNLNYGDICLIDETQLPDFDLFSFGSPCQDFSVAGKQKGAEWTCNKCNYKYNPLDVYYSNRKKCPNCDSRDIEKTRSSLIVEALRIIKHKQPKYLLMENVKNLVGKSFKPSFDKIIKELNEYGYNTYWKVLNAKEYGIPQNRERVFVFCIQKDFDNSNFQFPTPFDNGLRLKDLLDDKVDEKYYISQEKINQLITTLDDKNSLLLDMCQARREGKPREYTEYSPTLSARYYKEPRLINEQGMLNDTPKVAIKEATKKGYVIAEEGDSINIQFPNSKTRRGRVGKKVAQTLETSCNQAVLIPKPELVGGIGEVNFGKQYRQGNRIYSSEKTAMCLLSQPVGNTGGNSYLYNVGYRIRKLTPKECWRLMGFDDEDFQKAQEVGTSDTQLYQQAGNSIVVNVLEEIFKKAFKPN